jgi:hypothetical protein
LKQAYIKIKDVATHTTPLRSLGEIMHNTNCSEDQYINAWAKSEAERVANELIVVEALWRDVKLEWLAKTKMWVVGNRNIPYARQDTYAVIENYHTNLKATLHSLKGRFHERRVDWVIHVVVGDVLLHYWYSVLRKNNGFVLNRKKNNL